jgi:hypothetical protein
MCVAVGDGRKVKLLSEISFLWRFSRWSFNFFLGQRGLRRDPLGGPAGGGRRLARVEGGDDRLRILRMGIGSRAAAQRLHLGTLRPLELGRPLRLRPVIEKAGGYRGLAENSAVGPPVRRRIRGCKESEECIRGVSEAEGGFHDRQDSDRVHTKVDLFLALSKMISGRGRSPTKTDFTLGRVSSSQKQTELPYQ